MYVSSNLYLRWIYFLNYSLFHYRIIKMHTVIRIDFVINHNFTFFFRFHILTTQCHFCGQIRIFHYFIAFDTLWAGVCSTKLYRLQYSPSLHCIISAKSFWENHKSQIMFESISISRSRRGSLEDVKDSITVNMLTSIHL